MLAEERVKGLTRDLVAAQEEVKQEKAVRLQEAEQSKTVRVQDAEEARRRYEGEFHKLREEQERLRSARVGEVQEDLSSKLKLIDSLQSEREGLRESLRRKNEECEELALQRSAALA